MDVSEPFSRPFKFRLNCIDHYQALATFLDPILPDASSQGLDRPSKVPVIRVFGSTETGQKVCAHVHGAFPYLFIEYKGSLKAEEGCYKFRLCPLSTDAVQPAPQSTNCGRQLTTRWRCLSGKTRFTLR
jgi:hypothetical protein